MRSAVRSVPVGSATSADQGCRTLPLLVGLGGLRGGLDPALRQALTLPAAISEEEVAEAGHVLGVDQGKRSPSGPPSDLAPRPRCGRDGVKRVPGIAGP